MSSKKAEEVNTGEIKNYIKLNFVVSISLIVLIFLISSLNNNPLISLITLPVIFILTYYEEKANFITIFYGRYIYLLNSVGIVVIVIFWILPFLGIIQFLLLTISLYIIFHIFERLNYFQGKTVLVIHNLLVAASFTIILYSFLPVIELVYLQFIVDSTIRIFSNILIHAFIVLGITLLSFYFSYVRIRLYEKPWKFFNYCIVTLFLLLETIWFVLVTIKNAALGIPEVFQGELILSAIILPIVFLLFVLVNYIIRIFSREISLSYSYYACWFLLFSIFFTIVTIFWNNFVILLLDVIFISIFTLINLKFGLILKKVKDSTFNFIIKIDSFAILIEIFLLFYGIFSLVYGIDEIISVFLSCCVIGVIFNLLPPNVKIIPRKVKLTWTLLILIVSIAIATFYVLIANDELYVYLITPIIICFLAFAPIYYLYSEKVLKPKFIAIYTYSSAWLLMFLFFALNFYIIVIYFNTHLIIGTILNLLFLSICLIILITYGMKIRMLKESRSRSLLHLLSYPIVFEVFAILITIFVIYLKLDLLISLFLSLTVMSLIVYLDSKEHKLFPKVLTLILNSFTLYLGLFMVGFYSVLYTMDSFLVYFIPLILVSPLSCIPIYYLHKKNVLNKKTLLIYYFLCSNIIVLPVFILNFFIIALYFFLHLIIGTILNLLFISICLIILISYGKKIRMIKESISKSFLNFISYPIAIEVFALLLTTFMIYMKLDLLISSFLSLLIISLIVYLDSKKTEIFPLVLVLILNSIALYLGIFIVGYYSALYTMDSFLVYFVPLILISLLSYIPIYYLHKKNKLNKKSFLIYHFICSSIIVLSVFVFNFYINATIFSPMLYSLIVLNILYITIACYYILKLGVKIDVISQEKVNLIENYISYLVLFEAFFIMFAIFNQQLRFEPFFSAYISIVLTCLIINFLTKKRILFTEKISLGFNIITLLFTSILISFYVYIFLSPTVYAYIIPLLILGITLLLPLLYSLNKNVFTSIVQKLLIIDSLVVSGLIISLPYVIGLDFIRLGIAVDYYIINSTAIALFFGFLVFLEYLFDKTRANSSRAEPRDSKESYFVSIKTCQIITWVVLSLVISMKIFAVLTSFTINSGFNISCSLLIFLVLNLVILIPLENLKQRIFENDLSKYDYYRIYKIYEYTKNISYFLIEFTIASLTIFLVPFSIIYSLLQLQESLLLTFTTNIGVFLLSFLIISTISRSLFKVEFSRLRWIFDISAWLIIKILLCFYILIFPAQLSLIQRIGLPLLIVTFLSPITIYYLRNNFFISDDSLTLYKKLIYYMFYFVLIIIFSELFWNYSQIVPFYSTNQTLRLIVLFCGIFSFFNYYLVKYNERIANASEFKLIKILLGPSILLFSFFSIFPSNFEYFAYAFFVIIIFLFISNRNRNFVFRTISYFSLSLLILVKLTSTLVYYMLIPPFELGDFSYYLFYFSFSLMIVLFFSIVINIRSANIIEKFTIYVLISILTFLLLLYNTIIPLIYIISFSLFLFLLLTGNFYYRKKNDIYKWFIRPCVLLMVFSLSSFLSFYILFNSPTFLDFNPILTFALTLSVTSICYVWTYNKAPENFRRITFLIAFSSYIISIPTFMYFFLNAYLNLPIWDPFLFIITVNIGVLLFYLSVGLYYWKFSWAIWKMGWRLWIIVPFLNFYIINEIFTGIDINTNALHFFGININGSFIISFTICVLLSLPFWYTWIKKHFSRILLIIWSFSLFFLYWFSQNVFTENVVITNIVFFVFAVSLLMPVFYRMRMWKVITLLWLFYIFINVTFLVMLFQVILLPLEINLSISLIVLGFFFIILSFFPNLKNLKNIMLASSYFLSLIGVFLTIFFILNSILLNFFVSINISFIILAFSLFSSRFLKLDKTFFNIIISSVLVVNFSFFTYNTFILIPIEDIEIIAVSLAITVFGGSTLVFNKYRMILPLKKIIPLSVLSFGASLTLSSLVYIFLPEFIFLVSAIFVFVNLIIIRPALYEYRFILRYISPLALTLLTLQFIVLIGLFQSLYFIVLLSLLIYSAYFSVSRVLYPKKIEADKPEKDYGMKKFDSILSLLSHFELGLLSFGLIQELMIINLYGAILLSVFILFLSSLLDIHILKRTIQKIIYLVNILAFLIITIGGSIYFVQITGTDVTLFVLNLVIFLVLQFYTLHYLFHYIEAVSKYDIDRIKKIRNQLQAILLNIIFLVISFYISLLLNDFLLAYNPLLIGIPSLSFFLSIFSLLMFLLNGFLNRTIEIKYKSIILFSTFIAFQLFFGIFWLALFATFAILDFLRIALVILSETILTAYTIHLSKGVIKSEEWVLKTKKIYSGLALIIYLETSIVFLGLFGLFFGFFESLLYSQIILFLITLLDIRILKRLIEKISYLVNILAYLIITIGGLIYFAQFAGIDVSLFVLNLVIFLILQFYTIHYISYYIEVITKYEADKIKEIRNKLHSILLYVIFLVVSFYVSLLLNNLLLAYNPLLLGISSLSFFLSVFSLLMFLLNIFINRLIKVKYKETIIFSTFIAFQLFFGIFGVSLFATFAILDFLRIASVILSETVLIAYMIHLSKGVIKSDEWVTKTKKIYSGLVFIIYLETSIVFFGFFGLFFGLFESLLFSQIILFLISILEIYGIKRLKAGYMEIVHCLSFFNSSWVLSLILIYLYGFSIASLFYIFLLFLSMQFYTNISYFNIRSKFNTEKLEIFEKWKTNRQNFLGIGLYVFLIISIYNLLTAFGIEIYIAILILSIITHLIGLLDKFLLKFLKKTSKFFIVASWIVMMGFSILFYVNWISLFFPHLIPITILLFTLQIAYLSRLISEWDFVSSNISRINKGLILIVYLDLITWPLYYINPEPYISFNLVMSSFIILLFLTFVDKYIKVVSDKTRHLLRISSFIFIETLLSIDIFIALELINPNLIFNLCVSLFIFMIVNLVLFKPFKRSKLLSFLYSGLMFLLLSFITFDLTSNGWSFSWILIGLMLYLFIFMLEELKKFLNNIIDNIRFALIKFKNALLSFYYSILNYFKKHLKVIEIILCLFLGIIVIILFIEDVGVLKLLRWDHASLLGGGTSGILISLLPVKKTDDLDQVFRQRMQRFITLWISFTVFVFALILPYITSIIFGIVLILSSIIILGAILAIYIYRIEKKQKISIKWRFYTTILLITLTIIWVILLVILYFTEIVT